MPDSPNPNLHAGAATAAPGPTALRFWPSPPFASYPRRPEDKGPVPCVIQDLAGRVAQAQLLSIDFRLRGARVKYDVASAWTTLRFDAFLSLTLTNPLAPDWKAAAGSRMATDLLQQRPRTPYRIELRGGRIIAGQTIGHLENDAGIFLFPLFDASDRVVRMFLPRDACVRRELGAPLGQVLVEQHAASPQQVEQAAVRQARLRARKLGELMVEYEIITAEALQQALDLQARTPGLRIGDALLALGMIRPAQLHAVVELQQRDRLVPIGELLVRQRVIRRDELRAALARQLGHPVVDLARFPIEAAALRCVPPALARRLGVLPLALGPSSLIVAMEDVTRGDALDELAAMARIKVVPAQAEQATIDRLLPLAYARIGAALEEPADFAPVTAVHDEAAVRVQHDGPDGARAERQGGAPDAPAAPRQPAAGALAPRTDERRDEADDADLLRWLEGVAGQAPVAGRLTLEFDRPPGRAGRHMRFGRAPGQPLQLDRADP